MLPELSKKITLHLLKRGVITKEEEDVYEYGFQIFLYNFLEAFVIVLMGMVFRRLVSTIVFLVCFIFLRYVCGGYHATTRSKCFLLTIVLWFISVFGYTFYGDLLAENNKLVIPVILICLISIGYYAPVELPGKQLNGNKVRRNKLLAFSFCGVASVFILIAMVCFPEWLQYTVTLLMTMAEVVLLMVYYVEGSDRNEKN